MKKILILVTSLLLSSLVNANCEISSYYAGISNESGYDLKSSLSSLLSRTHRSISYDDLHKAYKRTDIDLFYEADGTIMDMYSENPRTKDPYNYKPGKRKCGQASGENSCYNREHLFPQGLFHKRRPMKTDIFHVYPTDGRVNNRRGSFPFGEVGVKARWVSKNGSKVGSHKNRKDFSGLVFEPLDEFKGDIARAMLYFAVRYERQIPRFKNNPMTDGSYEQTYSTWFLRLMLRWHKQDPVSEFETRRNNEACVYQHNRNPFIDHPEWASAIWEVK